MPKISTRTLEEHRIWRREMLIQAATEIALTNNYTPITISEVAKRAGISRTSVYEYFSSTEELVADLVIAELNNFSTLITADLQKINEPVAKIERWIHLSLQYVVDGRHLIMKALNLINQPANRAEAIRTGHRNLLAPITESLVAMGVADIRQALMFLQATTDVAAKRIESGADAEVEIAKTSAFCLAGLVALTSQSQQ